jgi:phenylacetate-CoA ligase
MREYYDDLETLDPELRETALFAALPGHIAHAKANAPFFSERLADVDPEAITDRAALARLPVTRKSLLGDLQNSLPPFGGLTAVSTGDIKRIFSSPGPIYEPQGSAPDHWRLARALHAAGFRKGDLIHNCFSFHFTPAGAMLESAAHAMGCTTFPGGTGYTEGQAGAMADLRPAGYVGTPSFLRIILDKAREEDVDVSSVTKALVSGEALPQALRAAITEYGVDVLQCYATAELGLIAYETRGPQGPYEGMVIAEDIIVEIVTPGTGDPVAEGETGEVVVTVPTVEYPLIRFATGDLSAHLPGLSPCGRSNARIKGWMGRADQSTKVKGMMVRPEQIAEVVALFDAVSKGRLIIERVEGVDVMTLNCEVATESEGLADALASALRKQCRLKGCIALVPTGSLANDGKIIDDRRELA